MRFFSIFVAAASLTSNIIYVAGYQQKSADALRHGLQPFNTLRLRKKRAAFEDAKTKWNNTQQKEANLDPPETEEEAGAGGLSKSLGNVFSMVNKLGANEESGKVMAQKENSSEDAAALVSATLTTVVMVFIGLMFFSVFRKMFPMVYMYRMLNPGDTGGEEMHSSHLGFFGWITAAWSVTNEEILQNAGLDALMFVEFNRVFLRLTLVLSPVAICILCPMFWIYSDHEAHPEDWLTPLGMGGLVIAKDHAPKSLHWVYCCATWLTVCLTLVLTYRSHRMFLQYRFVWLRRIPEPRSTTLMVEGIPPEYRSDTKLKAYFIHLFGEDVIQRVYMVRKTLQLQRLVANLEAKQLLLNKAQTAWDAVGRDPARSPKLGSFLSSDRAVNAVEAYEKQVAEAETEVAVERDRIEKAVSEGDLNAVSTSAFVTFRSQRWCRLVSREQIKEDSSTWVLGMPPDPADVVYEDFVKTDEEQGRGNCMGTFIIVLVFILWTPLVASSTALTSLSAFEGHIPWLHDFMDRFPALRAILKGVLATFALKILMGLFPTIMMTIIRNFYTLKSGSWAQLKLQNRFYIFQVVFVIFVGAVGINEDETIQKIFQSPHLIVDLLAKKLPKASNFYLNYIVLGNFTVVLEITRYFQLLTYACCRTWFRMDSESSRAMGEPEDQDCYGMGARFAKTSLVMTIALLYSVISPLIIVFSAVYFIMSTLIYTYLIAFAETKKPDLGGVFWVVSLKHILFALLLQVASMIGILGLQGRNGYWPAAATSPLFIVLYWVWNRLNQFNWEILPFEILATLDHDTTKRKSLQGALTFAEKESYIQPEMKRKTDREAFLEQAQRAT